LFSHTNRTPKSKSNITAQADAVFKSASKRKDVPEFDSRKYREDEERRIEQAIERQREQRLTRDANAPIKQHKQRRQHLGRPSTKRIPEAV
jgi:hypothetical protein